MVQTQDLMSKIQMKRWSEEEYLLRYDKYSSNMYSNNRGDLLESSSDKDVHHTLQEKMFIATKKNHYNNI